MSRRRRVHIPGGTYYVTRPVDSQSRGCLQVEDYALIEHLLPSALSHTGAQLLGYCWMPDAMHFAVRISTMPLGDLMRELTSHFAQHIHRRTGERGAYFRLRYQPMLIDPDAYLPKLIHHLHYLPVSAGLVGHPADYPWNSHWAYLGRAHHAWLDTRPVLNQLGGGAKGRIGYRQLLAEPPAAETTALFVHRGAAMPQILGNTSFITGLTHRTRTAASNWSLPELTAYVAEAHEVLVSDLKSPARRRELVIARARITWFATERRVATLGEVARYLNHNASCLSRAVIRSKGRHPELFALAAFSTLISWLSLKGVTYDQKASASASHSASGDAHACTPAAQRLECCSAAQATAAAISRYR